MVKGLHVDDKEAGTSKWLLKGPRRNRASHERRLNKRKLDMSRIVKKSGKIDSAEEEYAEGGPQESSVDHGFLSEVSSMDEYFEPYFDRSPSADVPPSPHGETGNMFSRDEPTVAPVLANSGDEMVPGGPNSGDEMVPGGPNSGDEMVPGGPNSGDEMLPGGPNSGDEVMPPAGAAGAPTTAPVETRPENEKPAPDPVTKAPVTLSPVYPPSFFGPTPPKVPTIHPPSFFVPLPTPRPTAPWPTGRPTRLPHNLSPRPTVAPTGAPTESQTPTASPSEGPTPVPTVSMIPTQTPTMGASTRDPTATPTIAASPTAPPTSVETSELIDNCLADDDGNYGSPTGPQVQEVVYRYQVETTSTVTADDLNNDILPSMEKGISDALVPTLFFPDGECEERPLTTTTIRRHGKPYITVEGVVEETDKTIAQKWALTWFSNLAPLDTSTKKSTKKTTRSINDPPRSLLERSLQADINASLPLNDTLINGTLPDDLEPLGEDQLVGLTAAPPDQVIRGRLQNACPSPVTGLGPDGQPLTCWVVEGVVSLFGFGNLSWVHDVVQNTLQNEMNRGRYDNTTIDDDLLYVRYIAPGTVLNTTADDPTRATDDEDSGTPTWAWVLIGVGIAAFVVTVAFLIIQNNNQGDELAQENESGEREALSAAGGGGAAVAPAPARRGETFNDEGV